MSVRYVSITNEVVMSVWYVFITNEIVICVWHTCICIIIGHAGLAALPDSPREGDHSKTVRRDVRGNLAFCSSEPGLQDGHAGSFRHLPGKH
jgi:hypothetical protein